MEVLGSMTMCLVCRVSVSTRPTLYKDSVLQKYCKKVTSASFDGKHHQAAWRCIIARYAHRPWGRMTVTYDIGPLQM